MFGFSLFPNLTLLFDVMHSEMIKNRSFCTWQPNGYSKTDTSHFLSWLFLRLNKPRFFHFSCRSLLSSFSSSFLLVTPPLLIQLGLYRISYIRNPVFHLHNGGWELALGLSWIKFSKINTYQIGHNKPSCSASVYPDSNEKDFENEVWTKWVEISNRTQLVKVFV